MKKYNEKFGDNKTCRCGHIYYRHFDSYEDMSPIGCKYCQCNDFVEKNWNKYKVLLHGDGQGHEYVGRCSKTDFIKIVGYEENTMNYVSIRIMETGNEKHIEWADRCVGEIVKLKQEAGTAENAFPIYYTLLEMKQREEKIKKEEPSNFFGDWNKAIQSIKLKPGFKITEEHFDIMIDTFGLLLNNKPTKEMLKKHYIDYNEDGELQDFSSDNAKFEWMTGVSIIEAVYNIVKDAQGNGNLKQLGIIKN